MKKYFSICLFIFFVMSLFVSLPVAHAATSKATIQNETKEAAPIPPIENKAEYVLPYPGMLADNPLYFLKKFRDQILELLIADPARKIEFYILQSDKELSAGILLGTKDKQELAAESFLRAGVYIEQAVKRASNMISQGKVVPSYIVERLGNSLDKQEDLLNEFVAKATESQKSNLTRAQEQVKKLQADVAAMK